MAIAFDNTYARLPEHFYARLDPTPVAAPRLLRVNETLAYTLGIDPPELAGPEGVAVLAGNHILPGAEPLALAYAGHQFGHFVPQLGDGRACLLGEVVGADGRRRDIQLKGSGPTPFSRRGDGRAAIGPVLREYLISEAMAALNIPTTRTLAAVATGEAIWRETMLPGAVLTRVAASHIRVGTFQYFAAQGDQDAVRILAEYARTRHYPQAATHRAFLDAVIAAQADLVAKWLLVGFIHGVMNTDNCAISGETIDYGPCAFMDTYDPATVFSSIDHAGRYAYGNQGRIALWNLARLAETLIPLLDGGEDEAKDALSAFPTRFQNAYFAGLRRKIGLLDDREGDDTLTQDLLKLMLEHKADFTLTFRRLADPATRASFGDGAGFDDWTARWQARLAGQDPAATRSAMDAVNPIVIPRNHLVEEALAAAVEREDLAPFETLLSVVSRPYDDPLGERFTRPPSEDEKVLQTFCGT